MNNTGIKIPEIMLPNENIDMTKWAVVACDQFTSENKYWQELEELVGENYSTLKMIFPEAYLSKDNNQRIVSINANMNLCLDNNVLKSLGKGIVLVERQTPYAEKRLGLVLSVDLEEYNFEKGKKPLIRATEGTIIERLPPRIKIRENAKLEFPHIMLLIDDENKNIIEKVYAEKQNLEKIYDFDLNMNGGHIKGYFIKDTTFIENSLSNLLNEELLMKKYGESSPFLFAVGDGNHSLATAKMCWDNLKNNLTETEKQNHPARFALVEVVNLYDDGLVFEPIHRLVKNVEVEKFLSLMNFSGEMKTEVVFQNGVKHINLSKDIAKCVQSVDDFIANYIKDFGGEVDYIHGEESLKSLASQKSDCLGFMLPKMDKKSLFKSVVKFGALPRKTFSMGEAVEKRYYIESKMIQR